MPIAAGVVGDAGVGAVGALLDVAAQLRRAAELDRAHDAPLGEAEMPRVGGAPGGPEAAEDVRHLELRPGMPPAQAGGGPSEVEQIERALHLPDRVQGDPGVARRRGDLPMPQQVLDHPDVDALLEQVGGEAVPQGVHGHRLVDLGHAGGGVSGALERARRDRCSGSGPETARRASGATPVAQEREQLRREHGVAVLAALALATWMIMRWSMSPTWSATTSETRRPAP